MVFALLAGLILSFYGGGFATVPAYLRDLFGTFQVGAIHGRLLTAWSAAGVAGPLIENGNLDTQGEPEGVDSPAIPADVGDSTGEEGPVPGFLLPVAWLVVGIPLAYGIYETVSKAIDLFG